MMMHAKSDSDITSLDQSSPRSSPKRAVYYVQSPSRDSHDGDKSSSIHVTPTDSPSHPSYGSGGGYGHRHSLASSASRFSGTFRSKGSRCRGHDDCSVIEEEGGAYDLLLLYGDAAGLSRRRQCLAGVLGLAGVFAMFCLVLWGASRPYRPQIAVESVTVHNFYIGAGSDLTGVPTMLLTLNCSVKMKVHNPATFFGIHVSSTPVNLMYSEITVATGQLREYYQPRKSQRTVSVNVGGNKVPLYGAGAGLAVSEISGGVPLVLLLNVRSRGDVVGTLVRSNHQRHASCHLAINAHNTKTVKLNDKSCTYD